MRQIIQEVVDTLENFIANGERNIMLLEAVTDDAPLLLKSFAMIEENETSPDIFLTHSDEFHDTRRFVELVIERRREEIAAVNEELAKRKEPLRATLADEILARELPSSERFSKLFQHIRQIVEAERAIIWTFFPLAEIEKSDFYVALFEPVARQIINGDFGNTKLIVRDTSLNDLREKLGCEPENAAVFCYRPQLDFKSVMEKVEAQSKDETAPVEERMQSLMLTAGVDIAEQRFDDALYKNHKVLNYYQKTGQRQNESIVQNNIGDVYYVQGKFPEAQENYEKAITISVEEKSQPLVLYQSMNVGNSLLMQERYDEAFQYYDSAEKLAEVNKILIQRIQALERMGDCKMGAEATDEAIEIYEKAADLCRENKYALGLHGILTKLCPAYEKVGDEREQRECERELEETKAKLDEINPALTEKADEK